jgi:hypothetical protein
MAWHFLNVRHRPSTVPIRIVHFLKRIGLPLHYIPTRDKTLRIKRRKKAAFPILYRVGSGFDNPRLGPVQIPPSGPGNL